MFPEFLQIALVLLLIILIVPWLGGYMAKVFLSQPTFLDRFFTPLEGFIYKLGGLNSRVAPDGTFASMTGGQYIRAVIYSNLAMGIFVALLLALQGQLPLNPSNLPALTGDTLLHTVISFVTNTDQQHYTGETSLSYASQMLGLGFLMFTSAATGLAVGIAFIRGLTGRPLGNFYVDFTLAITRILLPLSLVFAIALIALGIPETLAGPATVTTLEGTTQAIARGPIAHFEAIKQLGENGGGFFGANSAHPFENPNAISNLLENLAMVVIPASLIYTYGVFADNKKQGWLVFSMVFVLYVVLTAIAVNSEIQGNPIVNSVIGKVVPNLEGKETRFGAALTAFWAVTTTATMAGAVNGMHDALMPGTLFATMSNMFLQVIWGGQGTGTAFLFVFLILTVFLTGLMVGRTPEFLGRKIEKQEIVLASVVLLIHPIAVLIPSAITLAFPDGLAGISNPGFHGLSQVVYEYTSAAANNGSGLEGLADSQPAASALWWNWTTSISLLLGRYVTIVALLLLAENMSKKQPVPPTTGTLRTDTTLFTSITATIIVILGALTFFPVLALGPLAEAFQLVK